MNTAKITDFLINEIERISTPVFSDTWKDVDSLDDEKIARKVVKAHISTLDFIGLDTQWIKEMAIENFAK